MHPILAASCERQSHPGGVWVDDDREEAHVDHIYDQAGAKSGQLRTWPLLGLRDEDRVAVIASNYGQDHHPAWYHNLRASPHATILVDGAATPVLAHEAEGRERDRLWQGILQIFPGYAVYERRAAPRRIPVLVLTPSRDRDEVTA